MPKRKARPADIADQSPKSKLQKKEPSKNQPKYGGSGKKKVSPSASSAEPIPQKKELMGVSSNWKTLSKVASLYSFTPITAIHGCILCHSSVTGHFM